MANKQNNADEKVIKGKYMEYQLINKQLKELHQQIESLQEQLSEIIGVIQNISEIKSTKEGTEILVPVSTGIFMKAMSKESDKLIVNVGSNTAVEKPFSEVKAMLEKQKDDMEGLHAKLIIHFQKINAKSDQIEEELKKLVED